MSKSALSAGVTLALLAAFAASSGSEARAERIDPTLPVQRSVGTPAGAQPMYRVDAARTGRSKTPLPTAPRVLWRARVTGGLDLPVAVDARRHVIAASPMSQLVELDENGKLAWTLKTGSSAPVLGPVITTNGTRVVITANAELWAVAPNGTLRTKRSLPLSSVRSGVPPLAARDGGVVLGLPGTLLYLDASGDIQARAKQTDAPVSLVEQGGRTLIVTERGDVLEWKPPREPTKLGSFGGRVDEGAALSSPNHLTAVVDHERLVDFKLSSKTRHVRLSSTDRIQGPPAILANGETRLASFAGVLLGHDRTGIETARAELEPSATAGASVPGLFLPPPLVVDEKGRVAFVRPGLDAGVVLETGESKAAAGAACGDPVALAPAGPGRFVVACRSGLILLIGQ
ncbi:MAG: PQQ-binding-like beta-propeller repeat protein [Polyangiaceae bacterium]|nr:PQQ-binding-like beta-propeller repeat protein [Polyangiaceae bacterium]